MSINKVTTNTATREEWHRLLVKLKTTVEGLLSMPCSDVWGIYGGLDRISGDLEQIMCNKLRVTIAKNAQGNPRDFWEFSKGLRWLHPVMAPSIERYSKISPDSRGKVWIRQSLLEHNLASQLLILSEPSHLQQYYHEDAFLFQKDYFQCLIICLQAVEQNSAGLLADINPYSLIKKIEERDQREAAEELHLSLTHATSAFIDIHNNHHIPTNTKYQEDNQVSCEDSDSEEMLRRSAPHDRLAPPMLRNMRASSKTDSVLLLSGEHAVITPGSYGSSSDESAKEALLNLLSKSGDAVDDEPPTFYSNISHSKYRNSDPLMHVEIVPSLSQVLPTKHSLDNLTTLSGLGVADKGGKRGKRSKSKKKIRYKEKKDSSYRLEQERIVRNENVTKTSEVLDSILNNDEELSVIVSEKRANSDNTQCNTNSDNINLNTNNDNIIGEASLDNSTSQDLEHSRDYLNLTSPGSIDSGYSTIKLESRVHVHSSPTTSNNDILPVKQDSSISSDRLGQKDGNVNSEGISDSSSQKRLTHYRSMSDFGVPGKGVYEDGNMHDLSSTKLVASSSLPKGISREDNQQRSSFFHQPAQGESLIGFLSSQDFHTCAELDKENAHFSICETLISAIETMKWNQVLSPATVTDDHVEGDSDEEIQQLKQRIRIRRRERMKEKNTEFPAFPNTEVTGSSTSQYTDDTPSDFTDSEESSDSSDAVHDADFNEEDKSESSNLKSLKESGLSLSLASLYSEQELHRSNLSMERSIERKSTLAESSNSASAESVAIALLKRFSEKQLPKASELEWLVSEQDAPQRLLPLPDSYPVSPDDNENADLLSSGKRPRLRGNLEWAPPRAQIIFNIHPPPKKKVVIAKQNYFCAGCGTKVERGYMRSYHYCEYLGKYFCACCHSKNLTYIPGYILRKWDFTKYYVSHFSRNLLQKIYSEPLYSITHINAGLYRKVKALDQIKDYRSQIVHLVAFLKTCRLAKSELSALENCPSHWTTDVHIYSLQELVQVKKGELLPVFKNLVTKAIQHISQCLLCQAKGFICELCNNDNIIFPFELGRVVQCNFCRACFHKNCFTPDKCPKCIRIENRRQRLEDQEGQSPS